MTDITQYKIKDIYSGVVVRVSDTAELEEWLTVRYERGTLTSEQQRCIVGLRSAIAAGDDPTWWAASCGLEITAKKKTRRKTK